MTSFQIVALYLALNLILVCVLMMRVGSQRMNKKVNIGDGGDSDLQARIRAHGNYTENAPLALLGLIVLAMMNAHSTALHIFGSAFLIGRILHAHGMAQKGANGKGRGIGMMLTMLALLGPAFYLLYLVFTFTIN